MSALTPSQVEAAARIRRALQHIERAQNDLNEACSAISSIADMLVEWERLGAVADTVTAEWHRLNGVAGPFELDPMAKAAFLKRTEAA